MDEPRGLIGGRAPLLSELMRRRAALRHRGSILWHAIDRGVCPVEVVAEYNAISDVLKGRPA